MSVTIISHLSCKHILDYYLDVCIVITSLSNPTALIPDWTYPPTQVLSLVTSIYNFGCCAVLVCRLKVNTIKLLLFISNCDDILCHQILISDFPAWLSLKAGSLAWLLEASGLLILRPEPFIEASNILGLSWPASHSLICYWPKQLTSHSSYVGILLFNILVACTDQTTISTSILLSPASATQLP